MIHITVQLPEDIAHGLEARWKDLSRAALEAMAIEGYRTDALTGYQVRRMLGFQTRYELDGFLKRHNVWEKAYSLEDFQKDEAAWQQLKRPANNKVI